ncbi:MAG: acyl-CoA dehydrogenase family protein [Bdellovibrionota bacterium]
MDFHQAPPTLSNTFLSDSNLKDVLKKYVAPDFLSTIEKHLDHVGELACGKWLEWSREAEARPPELTTFDPWGRRIDRIRMSEGWKNLEAAAATEGIVASGYERKFGDRSRVYQAALLYLFHPSSAFVSCPLAMTDGAARAIELYGDDELKKNAFTRLTSRDPSKFWTSGQWMTEKTGGSDVSGTSTIASPSSRPIDGFDWKLDGVKWFTSATTSQMAMLLARPDGAELGSRGLSLFYTELRDGNGALKNIEILRLKDKLGTRALATAELHLRGTPAKLVGSEGGGVRKISSLFNITRVYNSVCATGHFRRALDLAQSYSRVREAFGRRLVDHPLHAATLEHLEDEYAKCLELSFYVAHLLGKDECGTASEDERILLRALTPIVKLFTAKRCMEGVSEVVELFGGAGYVEDTGIPTLLRDAQVFSIWEGTTNVLSLDFLRALEKENAAPILLKKIQNDFASAIEGPAKAPWETMQSILKNAKGDRASLEREARRLAFAVAEIVALGLRT